MQTTIKILDDLAKVGSSVVGLALGIKNEMKQQVKSCAESWARDLDLVSREEFEVVRSMAQKAREENEKLKARVDKLEKKPVKKSTKTAHKKK